MADEFRIEFTITRCEDGEDDFTEIGFGTSGTWSDVDQCAHMVVTDVQNRQWETEPGMPEPADVKNADAEMPDRPDHSYDGCPTCVCWREHGGELILSAFGTRNPGRRT